MTFKKSLRSVKERSRKSLRVKLGQSVFEYFVLFTVISGLTFISTNKLLPQVSRIGDRVFERSWSGIVWGWPKKDYDAKFNDRIFELYHSSLLTEFNEQKEVKDNAKIVESW